MLRLHPFPGSDAPAITIEGEWLRSPENQLTVRFVVTGAIDTLKVAPAAASPERQDELWKTTCLEFFLGVAGERRYFEFNLSPSGHWNVYAFDDYRAGMRPQPTVTTLPFVFERHPDRLELHLSVDLGLLVPPTQTLELSGTAVIEELSGRQSFWALSHAGPHADYHLRASFTHRLETGV